MRQKLILGLKMIGETKFTTQRSPLTSKVTSSFPLVRHGNGNKPVSASAKRSSHVSESRV